MQNEFKQDQPDQHDFPLLTTSKDVIAQTGRILLDIEKF
jgi:hypothetical protein